MIRVNDGDSQLTGAVLDRRNGCSKKRSRTGSVCLGNHHAWPDVLANEASRRMLGASRGERNGICSPGLGSELIGTNPASRGLHACLWGETSNTLGGAPQGSLVQRVEQDTDLTDRRRGGVIWFVLRDRPIKIQSDFSGDRVGHPDEVRAKSPSVSV
jgi:hypothetical protein